MGIFRRKAHVAAVGGYVANESGIARLPGKRKSHPYQDRARFFARRLSFVGNTYRFMAWQAARCPWTVEMTENGSDWAPAQVDEQPIPWEIMRAIRSPRGSQSELTSRSIYLDDTVGEFFIVDDSTDGSVGFSVRDVSTVRPLRSGGFLVSDAPGGSVRDGTARAVPAGRLFRHWQPDEEYDLVATSSLIGLVDDIDVYWSLLRALKRKTRSRLAMSDILWIESSNLGQKVPFNGRDVYQVERDLAEASAGALDDEDDRNVASVAPFLMHGTVAPEMVPLGALDAVTLEYLTDQRRLVADGLPLSTSAIFDGDTTTKPNHWSEWLANDRDEEAISSRYRRVLDSWTSAVFRPALRAANLAGSWRGDPEALRLGFDPSPIHAQLENAENAKWASDRGLIADRATLRELHLRDSDMPTEDEIAVMGARRALFPLTARSDGTAPSTGEPPNEGNPPALAAAPAMSLAVLDDRWLLND